MPPGSLPNRSTIRGGSRPRQCAPHCLPTGRRTSSHPRCTSAATGASAALLLRCAEVHALALHLIDDGLGALVAFRCELSSSAGERLELLAQLDRLLHCRFLRVAQIRQGTPVMDGL